uniref:Head-tail joining protein n=1 Tax=viral metagenome TaxID=1070528 RepID=A0A6M3LAV6_9ZZZZ
MSINFSASKTAWDNHVFENFKKTLTRTPVTKTTSNITGNETLTDGTEDDTYEGILFKEGDTYNQEYVGLFKGADAILLIKTTQTLNKDDKIEYDGDIYRVLETESRYFNSTEFYKAARLFLVE